jgi:2-dehydro-3-deoxygalactonokinase
MTFISCDWGTSSFRCRLIGSPTGAILAEIKSPHGIAATFDSWQKSGLDAGKRWLFYQAFLLEQIQRLGLGLTGLPLIISGMASSSLGMMELPYKECPFFTDGRDLSRLDLPPTPQFPHPLTLISGIRTADDVMRGEETLLVGAMPDPDEPQRNYIFPGTHSKHVLVQKGIATGFRTYMTGEFFSILSQHSILANSLSQTATILSTGFEKGVEDSRGAGLLHNAFRVRTNILFDKMSKEENHHYLSGLLIGAELSELDLSLPLTVVAAGHLKDAYTRALHQLGHTGFPIIDADQALIAAHCKILNIA